MQIILKGERLHIIRSFGKRYVYSFRAWSLLMIHSAAVWRGKKTSAEDQAHMLRNCCSVHSGAPQGTWLARSISIRHAWSRWCRYVQGEPCQQVPAFLRGRGLCVMKPRQDAVTQQLRSIPVLSVYQKTPWSWMRREEKFKPRPRFPKKRPRLEICG